MDGNLNSSGSGAIQTTDRRGSRDFEEKAQDYRHSINRRQDGNNRDLGDGRSKHLTTSRSIADFVRQQRMESTSFQEIDANLQTPSDILSPPSSSRLTVCHASILPDSAVAHSRRRDDVGRGPSSDGQIERLASV